MPLARLFNIDLTHIVRVTAPMESQQGRLGSQDPSRGIEDFFTRMEKLLNSPNGTGSIQLNEPKPYLSDSGLFLPSGTRIGRYEIEFPIGRGGMGIVYYGKEIETQSSVAIKTIIGGKKNSKSHKRFLREVESCRRLDHPNVITIIDYGSSEDLWYCVMPFIDGCSLEKLISPSNSNQNQFLSQKSILFSIHGSSLSDGDRASGLNEHRTFQSQPMSNLPFATGYSTIVDDDDHCFLSDLESTEFRLGEALPESFSAEQNSIEEESNDNLSAPRVPQSLNKNPEESYETVFWRWVAQTGKQAADAIHFAHNQGVIHRDIKPSNLLLDSSGTHLYVADFGLAKIADDDKMTVTGDLLGTIQYMAPEVLSEKATAQSDVYSLGLTLYELISSRCAFPVKDQNRMIQEVLTKNPPKLSSIVKQVPKDLDRIVHRAIEKMPEDRYPTAKAFSEDLQRFIEGRPILRPPKNYWLKIKRFARKNKSAASYIAGSLALLVILMISTGLSIYGFLAASNAKRMAEKHAEKEFQNRISLYKDSVANEIDSIINDTRLVGLSGRVLDVREKSLSQLKEAQKKASSIGQKDRWESEIRNLAVSIAMKPNIKTRNKWLHPPEHEIDVDTIAFSSHQLFYTSPITTVPHKEHFPLGLFRVNKKKAELAQEIQIPGTPLKGIWNLFIATDGKWAVVRTQTDKGPRLFFVDFKQSKVIPFSLGQDVESFAVSESEEEIAVVHDQKVHFFCLPTLKEKEVWENFGLSYPSICSYSTDGSKIAIASKDEVIGVMRANPKQQLFRKRIASDIRSICWRPDGKQVAIGHRGRIRVIDVTTRKMSRQLPLQHREVHHIHFCNDGKNLVSTGREGGTLFSCPESGRLVKRLPEQLCSLCIEKAHVILYRNGYFIQAKIEGAVGVDSIRSPGPEPDYKILRLKSAPFFWICDSDGLYIYDFSNHQFVTNYRRIPVSHCCLDYDDKNFFFVSGRKVFVQKITRNDQKITVGSPQLLADFRNKEILSIKRCCCQKCVVIRTKKEMKNCPGLFSYEEFMISNSNGWKFTGCKKLVEGEYRNLSHTNPLRAGKFDWSGRLTYKLLPNNGIRLQETDQANDALSFSLHHEDPIQKVLLLSERRWLFVERRNFRFTVIDLFKIRKFVEDQGMIWTLDSSEVGIETKLLDYQIDRIAFSDYREPLVKIPLEFMEAIRLQPAKKIRNPKKIRPKSGSRQK